MSQVLANARSHRRRPAPSISWRLLCCALLALAVSAAPACGDGEVPVNPEVNGNPGTNNPPNNMSDAGDMGFGGGDGGGPATSELLEAERAIVRAECAVISQCCSDQQAQEEFGLASVDDCRDNQNVLPVGANIAALSTAIEQGRVSYNAAAAELCASSFAQQSCEDFTVAEALESSSAGCVDAFVPLTDIGSPCRFAFECAGGWCDFPDADPEADGVCTAWRAEGESCGDVSQRCDPSLVCDTFFSNRCVVQRGAGERCSLDDDCLSGRCEVDASGQERCVAPVPFCQGGG